MMAYDAIFLAIAAAGVYDQLPDRWYVAGAAPLLVYAATLLSLGTLAVPAAALAAIALAPRIAPAALLLTLPAYTGWTSALVAAAVWVGATAAFEAFAQDRLDGTSMPALLRGGPGRLIALGILYYALAPVAHL
jgi:hypothetical protein